MNDSRFDRISRASRAPRRADTTIDVALFRGQLTEAADVLEESGQYRVSMTLGALSDWLGTTQIPQHPRSSLSSYVESCLMVIKIPDESQDSYVVCPEFSVVHEAKTPRSPDTPSRLSDAS